MNLWLIFLTGLTTGGLSCLAVQGGFLASIIANQKEKELEHPTTNTTVLPVVLFLVAKLLIHVLLGFGLGLLGSTLTLSMGAKLLFQALAALFMFSTAMNLLNIHPVFRYVMLQPPTFVSRRIRRLSKNDAYIAPFILGLATVFIPCGVTQAMEVSAIALGNPIQSALLMAAFVVGTFPLFSIIGVAMAKLSEGFSKKFLRLAAFLLIGMSVYSFNGVLEALDAPVRGSRVIAAWVDFWTPTPAKAQNSTVPVVNGNQQVAIDILRSGYSPRYIRVKKGIPVQLTLRSNNVYSCALGFSLRAFGIRTTLAATDKREFTFTPTVVGKYPFTCTMGMYTGVIEVI